MLARIKKEKNSVPQPKPFKLTSLTKKTIGLINNANSALVKMEDSVQDIHPKIAHSESKFTTNFKTSFNSYSTFVSNLNKLESSNSVGFTYKCRLPQLIKTVFTVLKEMKIIWKKWNSEYAFK